MLVRILKSFAATPTENFIMAIRIICECGNKFSAEEEYAGRTVTCPECLAELDLSEATLERASPDDDWDAGDSAEDAIDETDSDITAEHAAEENGFEGADLSETNANPLEASSFDADANAPAMSTAERNLWSIIGLGGIVLVVLSVLRKFDSDGILISCAVVIPVFLFVFINRVDRFVVLRRSHGFRTAAHRLGLQFTPLGSDELHGQLILFQLDKVGQFHRLTNVIHGTIGRTQVAVFDFEYSYGKARPRQTVVRLAWRGAKIPEFSISPVTWFSKDLFELVYGQQGIQFDSDPTFTNNYTLRGLTASAVRRLFTGVVRKFYEQHPGLTTDVSSNRLFYFRAGVRVAPSDIQTFLSEAFQLLTLLQPGDDTRTS